MMNWLPNLASGILAGIAYATTGFISNKKDFDDEFDPDLYFETLAYGAIVGFVSAVIGVEVPSVFSAFAQVGGIYLLKKLKKIILPEG